MFPSFFFCLDHSTTHSQPVVDVAAEVGLLVAVVGIVVVVEVVVVVVVAVVVVAVVVIVVVVDDVVVSVIIDSAMFIFDLELEYYRSCSFSLQIVF